MLQFHSDLPPTCLHAVCSDICTKIHFRTHNYSSTQAVHTLTVTLLASLSTAVKCSASHRVHSVDKTPCGWNTITLWQKNIQGAVFQMKKQQRQWRRPQSSAADKTNVKSLLIFHIKVHMVHPFTVKKTQQKTERRLLIRGNLHITVTKDAIFKSWTKQSTGSHYVVIFQHVPTVSQEFASYYVTPSETSPQSFLPSSEKVLGNFPQHPSHPFRFCHCSFIIPVKTPSPVVWLMILPFHFYVLWEKMSKFHSYLSQILKYFDNLFCYPIKWHKFSDPC